MRDTIDAIVLAIVLAIGVACLVTYSHRVDRAVDHYEEMLGRE